MATALLTAIFGGYDQPKPLPADHGFDDAVLVTDTDCDAPGWRVIVDPQPDVHPRLAAKRPKCEPWRYTDADCSVWIDGAYEIRQASAFRAAADEHLTGGDLVVFAHPEDRDGPWAEAHFCHSWPKYRDWPLLEQVEHYDAAGLPRDAGLWALGCIARNHTAEQLELGAAWLAEQQRWGIQDQVSMPWLLWQWGITPGVWDCPQRSNPWLIWHAHRDDS